MAPGYAQTNLITREWGRLGAFYTEALTCEPSPSASTRSELDEVALAARAFDPRALAPAG